LSSTTGSALIELVSSTVTGNDAQSGGNFLTIADFGGVSGSPVASATVSLAGPLLSATNSTITSLFDLVQVRRSSLTSTTTSPLISLSGGTVTIGGTNAITGTTGGAVLDVQGSVSSGAVSSAASVNLAGPLLSMTGSATLNLTTAFGIVNLFGGPTVTSTTSNPFISITGSTMNQTNPSGFSNSLAIVGGLGGPSGTTPATLTLAGPLLSVSNSTLNLQGGLVAIGNTSGAFGTGTLIANDPTQPFVSLSGGTASIANVANGRLFVLRGTNTALDTDPLITALLTPITVGTNQPLQRSGSGAFLSLSNGATVTTQQAFFMDTALLSASAPLLDLSGGSTLTTASDGINLNQKAKLTSIGPLVQINGSTLNINGSAIRAQFGSGLAVTGDLFSISNAGKLNITNGGALFVSGGSVVNVTGALVNFSGTGGNQLNITNTLCTGCVAFGDFSIPVELRNGAIAGNVTITVSTNTIKGSGLGTLTVSNQGVAAGSTAVIILDGATSKVRIGGL
jgi:hypothetical protein